jgi:hypothetical protein
MLSGGELSYPGRIDAHLLDAAMDGAPIQITIGTTEVSGQIAFLPSTPPARVLEAGTPVEVRYTYKGRVWWFCARLFNRPSRNRWALLRPMRVFYQHGSEPLAE